jgi:DNA replication protein DnaC
LNIGVEVKDCKFNKTCKRYDGEECNNACYSYVFLHGVTGSGGFWGSRNVPKMYSNYFIHNLPIDAENPRVYIAVQNYCSNILDRVQSSNRGIYFTGGTGTGKTTCSVTILNEYLLARCIQHLKGEKRIEVNPVLFLKLSELQNIYNSQFRGTPQAQNDSATHYYSLKEKMKEVDLLVVDDIALRGLPEGFMNELYEIVDYRATEETTTLFTSNVTYDELPEFVGDRIASRIQGMCGNQVVLKGKDFRQGGLF